MTNASFVHNVVFSSCVGNKVGTESGGVKTDIVFRDNDIVQVSAPLLAHSSKRASNDRCGQARRGVVCEDIHGGADVARVLFENIRVERLVETHEQVHAHSHGRLKPIVPLGITATSSSIRDVVVRNVSWMDTGDVGK
eukprot:SAG22_NODE_1047_length_5859_cov_2.126042_4_plen_138_part_00